jgi:hypothetical protein
MTSSGRLATEAYYQPANRQNRYASVVSSECEVPEFKRGSLAARKQGT